MGKSLRLGKMTSKELAEWFQISYNTYKGDIQRRLDYLENFAKFEKVYGGVNILQVKIPQYIKPKDLLNDKELYLQQVLITKNRITTISGMIARVRNNNDVLFRDYTDNQLRYRLSIAGKEGFEKTRRNKSVKEGPQGEYGYRYYTWGIRIDGQNQIRQMTPQEKVILQDIFKQHYPHPYETMVQMSLDLAESEDTEIVDVLKYKTNFAQILREFKEKTGYQLIKATKHQLKKGVASTITLNSADDTIQSNFVGRYNIRL